MADEKKTPAELQRENIKVTNSEEKQEEVKEEVVQEEVKEEETPEDIIETSEEKEEQLEEEKKEAKTQADKDRIQRRIDREVAKRKTLEDENKELRAKLAAKPDDENVLTEEDVEKRANQRALEMRARDNLERDQDKIVKQGEKADPKFIAKVNALAEDIGKMPPVIVGILADLDNGGLVLNYLTDNVDEAEKIWAMNPTRMALELKNIDIKIAKKPEKKISKVPAPNDPVGGKGNNPEVLSDKDDMKDWVRKRNAQVEERKKARLGGLH